MLNIKTALLLALTFMLAATACSPATFVPDRHDSQIEGSVAVKLWLETAFGYCLAQVAGSPLKGFDPSLQGTWKTPEPGFFVPEDYGHGAALESETSKGVIYDLDADGKSCSAQISTPASDLAAENVNDVFDKLRIHDRIKTASVGTRIGPIDTPVLLIGRDRIPVMWDIAGVEPDAYIIFFRLSGDYELLGSQ